MNILDYLIIAAILITFGALFSYYVEKLKCTILMHKTVKNFLKK